MTDHPLAEWLIKNMMALIERWLVRIRSTAVLLGVSNTQMTGLHGNPLTSPFRVMLRLWDEYRSELTAENLYSRYFRERDLPVARNTGEEKQSRVRGEEGERHVYTSSRSQCTTVPSMSFALAIP